MKKLLALLLAMIMVLSMLALASCGGKDEDDDDEDEKTESTEKDNKKDKDEEDEDEEPEETKKDKDKEDEDKEDKKEDTKKDKETEEEPEDDDPAEMIVGKWEASVSGDFFGEAFMEGIAGTNEKMAEYYDLGDLPDLEIVLEFTDDGEVILSWGEDSIDDLLEELLDVSEAAMKEYLWDTFKEANGEDAKMADMWEQLGMDEEEFGEYVDSLVDLEDWKDTYAKPQKTEYEFKGDKLYVDGAKEDYELTSKKLVIDIGFDEPVEFKKAK